MGTEIERLEISAETQFSSAFKAMDEFAGKLEKISKSLETVGGNGLASLADGVSKLATSSQQFKNVQPSQIKKISDGLSKLYGLDSGKSGLSSSITQLASSLSTLGTVKFDGKNVTSLVSAVARLTTSLNGNVDMTKINEIGSALSGLVSSLSQAGSIEPRTASIVSSIARLASAGDKTGASASGLPLLGQNLNVFIRVLSKAPVVSEGTTQITAAIAKLASAGNRAGATAKNLDELSKKLLGFIQNLTNAPQVSASTTQLVTAIGNIASAGGRANGAFSSLTNGSTKGSHAVRSFVSSIKGMKSHLKDAKSHLNILSKSSNNLAAKFGMFYAKFFMVIRGIKKFGQALGSAQDYIEEFNYFSVALDKVGKDSSANFKEAGYNSAEEYANSFRTRFEKLQKQMTGYTVDYNTGDATSGMSHNLGLDLTEVMKYNAAISQITNSAGMLGETSIATSKALSMLAADWSSLSNQDLKSVMDNFQSGLVGQSRALYKYGIDTTSAGLAQTAMNHGIKNSISNLSQKSKIQLRVLTMLEQSKVAYGDLARTINQPANQLRMLQAGFKNLSRTIGSLFMPIVQKLYPYLNAMVMVLQDFAQWIAKLAGVKLGDIGGSIATPDYSDAADDSGTIAKNMDDTSKKAKKATDNLQGFDIVNKLDDNSSSDGDSDNDKNANIDLSKDIDAALKNYEKIWDNAFKSNKNKAVQLYKKMKKALVDAWKDGDFSSIGKVLANKLNDSLAKIPWAKIKATTKKIAKSIATFLNGFIKNTNWKLVGKTLAEGFNTAVDTLYTFVTTFDWLTLGTSIADAINSAVKNADFKKAGKLLGAKLRGTIQFAFGLITNLNYKQLGKKIGDAINGFLEDMGRVDNRTGLTGWQELGKTISDGAKGILDTIDTALSTVNWGEVGKAIGDFLGQLDWPGIFVRLGKVIAKALFSVFKVGISAFANDPLGVAGTLCTVLAGVFAYKKLKTFWTSLKTVFGNGISNALISAKINSKGLTDKFSGLGSKMGRAMGVALVAAYGWWENSITAGGDAKGNVKRYASGTDDKSILLKKVVQMMDKFGYGSNTLTVDRLVGRLNKKLESGEISEKTIRKALDKNYKTMTDKQSVQSAADFLDLLGESKGNVATKIDKSKKELNDYKPIITQTTKYSKAVDTLYKKMKKLGISSSESKSIQEKLKKALENGTITWEDYKKIIDKNYNSTDALKKKIDSLKPKSVKVEAKTDGKEDVDNLQTSVNNTKGKTVTVKAKTYGINSIGDLSLSMRTLKNKYISVNLNPKLRKDWYTLVKNQIQAKKFSLNISASINNVSAGKLKSSIKSMDGRKVNYDKLAAAINNSKNIVTIGQQGQIFVKSSEKELIKYLKKYGINYDTYANGGFPEDGWFRASHGEMIGKFDNGQSVVANNKQITDGISQAVAPATYAAVKAAVKEVLSEMPIGGDVYLDGTKVTTEIMSNAKRISKSKGITWKMA